MITIRQMLKMMTLTGFLMAWAASPGLAVDYAHKITEKNVNFEWTLKGEMMDIRISAPTTSWVGIGFNPSHMMKDANFIVGYVKKGKVKISDEYGKGNRTHEADTKAGGTNNVSNAMGSEAKGVTTLSFTIPINSGDSKDQALNINADTTVLLAYGSGRDSFRSRHKKHYVFKVNLSTGVYKDAHKH